MSRRARGGTVIWAVLAWAMTLTVAFTAVAAAGASQPGGAPDLPPVVVPVDPPEAAGGQAGR